MFSRTVATNLLRQTARSAAARPAPPQPFRAAFAPAVPRASPLAPLQRRLISAETRTAIEKAVGSAPVVLFMKGTPEMPQCGFSRAVIQVLGLQGVNPAKFAAFNVLEDDDLRTGIKEFSDWPTIPQLYVGGEFIGGCDVLVSMHQNGDLAKLFDENKVVVVEEGGAKA